MTRSHKINDRDHSAPQNGIIAPNEALPRYFAKSGPVDADPRKTKKDGGGKGNWWDALVIYTFKHTYSAMHGVIGILR